MIGYLSIVALGFLLGMRHATDPDHVIAVSTIVSHEGEVRRAALIGAAWGLGHTFTILVVGSAMILFRIALPPRIGLAMELAVGVMLILLGLRNLGGWFRWSAAHVGLHPKQMGEQRAQCHSHTGYAHGHALEDGHSHNAEVTPVALMDRWFRRSSFYLWARPLIIGIVHGLAGSAAIALLILSTIPNVRWAVAYLAVFGMGTILGMILITTMIGSTLAYGNKRFLRVGRHFGWAAGLISVGFGLFIAYQIGLVDGLFTAHAHWIPR
jgi:high-affinity nickel permease